MLILIQLCIHNYVARESSSMPSPKVWCEDGQGIRPGGGSWWLFRPSGVVVPGMCWVLSGSLLFANSKLKSSF
jgi:hypothetical protein